MRLLFLTDSSNLSSASIEQLRGICANYDVTEVSLSNANADPSMLDACDGVVIIGNIADTLSTGAVSDEVSTWLVATTKSVLAIGGGFDVLLQAYGVAFSELEQVEAASVLTPTDDGSRLFQGTDPLRVAATTRWAMEREELPKGWQVLARSGSGIEAVKHKVQPRYAIQVLPQDFTYASDSKLVFANLFAALEKAAG